MSTKLLAYASAALAALAGFARAEEVVLRAVNAFPEGTYFAKSFESFIEKVNADGKGVVRIVYLGGPRAMPPFEVGNAVKTGVVDIAHLPGAYYTNIMPEADAFKMFTKSPTDLRASGAFDDIDALHQQKMNTVFLARGGASVPFHLYLNKPINKPDLSGLKIRVTPIYKDFVEALGGTAVTTPQGEVFTALERGVVDGYGSPLVGIFDFGWQDVTKYRVDPGFYAVDIGVLVNLPKWTLMTSEQQAVLRNSATFYEELEAPNAQAQEAERAKQAEAGIEAIAFTPDDEGAYMAKANDTAWGSVLNRAPETGPKLKELAGASD